MKAILTFSGMPSFASDRMPRMNLFLSSTSSSPEVVVLLSLSARSPLLPPLLLLHQYPPQLLLLHPRQVLGLALVHHLLPATLLLERNVPLVMHGELDIAQALHLCGP